MPIPGSPPNLAQPISGCAFEPRCPQADQVCRETRPQVLPMADPGHLAACWMAERVGAPEAAHVSRGCASDRRAVQRSGVSRV